MLTADTITDEQIRELRKRQVSEFRDGFVEDANDLDYSFVALRDDRPNGILGFFTGKCITRQQARARCAEILNARPQVASTR